jgi:hypothetical protein
MGRIENEDEDENENENEDEDEDEEILSVTRVRRRATSSGGRRCHPRPGLP